MIIKNIDSNININYHTENKYEYYGINKIWQLANLYPEKIFLYFHSKGMFYRNPDNHERHPYEKYYHM